MRPRTRAGQQGNAGPQNRLAARHEITPRRHLVATKPAPPPLPSNAASAARYTLAARALRRGAMSAALVLIIVIALLCVALLALFGILWAALHFGIGEDDDD
jgi:hypothetical protein